MRKPKTKKIFKVGDKFYDNGMQKYGDLEIISIVGNTAKLSYNGYDHKSHKIEKFFIDEHIELNKKNVQYLKFYPEIYATHEEK
jgi:hypothetical protein